MITKHLRRFEMIYKLLYNKLITWKQTLNPAQSAAANSILDVFTDSGDNTPDSRIFFIDGPGASSKSYLYSYLCMRLRFHNLKILTTSWDGIFSVLLKSGKIHICVTCSMLISLQTFAGLEDVLKTSLEDVLKVSLVW